MNVRKALNPGWWIFIMALIAVLWGLLNSEAGRVMIKGATLCLECIGLG